jgi:transposase
MSSMPRRRFPSQPQPTVDAGPRPGAGSPEEAILGVDTHKDIHVAAVISAVGALLGIRDFPATATGYQALLTWAQTFGAVLRAGVEGTSSYGAALNRMLRREGVTVIEVNRPDRADRRRRGKSDATDAEAAARAVLSGTATATAKAGDGPVETARMFKLAKSSAVKSRTQAINQLKAVLVGADPALREQLAGLSNLLLVRACAALKVTGPAAGTSQAARHTLRILAERITTLTGQIDDLDARLTTVLAAHAPDLLARNGVAPDTAATLLIAAGDNPERLRSEAAFAALCGVSPVEASSGKTQRRRLNRGGNRQANAALHRVTLARLRWDPATRAYADRRVKDGKTRREAIRCLKRYIARELYPLLTPPTSQPPNTAPTAT